MLSAAEQRQGPSEAPEAWSKESRLEIKEQSLDERYAMPENFLEIEVCEPRVDSDEGKRYVTYEIRMMTNIPCFKSQESSVRRRYREFEYLRSELERENTRVNIPSLPGKKITGNFDQEVIEQRRQGLEKFLQVVAGHPLIQTGSKILPDFMQNPHWSIPE